jgi:hypothetical protein
MIIELRCLFAWSLRKCGKKRKNLKHFKTQKAVGILGATRWRRALYLFYCRTVPVAVFFVYLCFCSLIYICWFCRSCSCRGHVREP